MTLPSHKRGRYHHGNLPAALVEAAIEVVAEVGVEALTLREVAHRVGVTHAAPYRHFKGKGVLLAAVAEEGFARLAAAIEAARQSQSPLSAAGAAYIRFACEHAALYRLMFAAEERTAGLRTASNALLSEIAAATRDGSESSEVDDLARLLWSSWHGLATLHSGELLNASPVEVESLASAAAERLRSTPPPPERPERTSSPRIAPRGPDSSAPHPIPLSRARNLDELVAVAASGMGHDDEPSR
jgi:AcrR family transcriptional regulator